jgi:hypothetical protein
MTKIQNPGAVSNTAAEVSIDSSAKNQHENSNATTAEQLRQLRTALRDRAEAFANALLGPPVRWTNGNMRYSRSEGLSVCGVGENGGLWKDWDTGETGDALGLIQRVLKCDLSAAVEWASRWLKGQS